MFTSLPSAGDKHRLHFYIQDHKSELHAKQKFVTDDLNRPDAPRSVDARVRSKHTLSGTFASAFVEDNLVHVHSEVEEMSNIVHRLTSDYKKPPNCCLAYCCCCCFNCCAFLVDCKRYPAHIKLSTQPTSHLFLHALASTMLPQGHLLRTVRVQLLPHMPQGLR